MRKPTDGAAPAAPPKTPDPAVKPQTPGTPPQPNPGQHPGGGDSGPAENIERLGTAKPVEPGESDIHVLSVIGQIEGHVVLPSQNKTTKYEHVLPQLVAVEQNDKIRGLMVLLNTVGGDVEAGLAIAEMVRSLGKPSVSVVLGGGHSIGIPVAVAADRSFIVSTATMTVHPIRLTGMVIGVPQTYEYLEKMQDRIVDFIVQNSSMTRERLRELMFRTGELARDVGTILVGQDAVKEGLIEQVGGVAEAMAALRALINGRGPGGDGVPAGVEQGCGAPGAADGRAAAQSAGARAPATSSAGPGEGRRA